MITKKQAEELCKEKGAVTFVTHLENGDIHNAYDGFVESVAGDRVILNTGNQFTISVALENLYLSDGLTIQELLYERQKIHELLSEKDKEVNTLRTHLEENYKHLMKIL